MPTLTVGALFERLKDELQLDLLGSAAGLERPIETDDASGPGLVLAGYTGRFVHERVQVLGETEVSYLKSLSPAERRNNLKAFFGFPIPCVMVTKGQELPEGMAELASESGIAILRSQLKTQDFYHRLAPFLEDSFAPSTNLHGSLADVYGVGLLFTGQSGIGKSECVLDLVERGHRLVADDVVIARRKGADVIIASGHPLQRHFMEIRGVGRSTCARSSASARCASRSASRRSCTSSSGRKGCRWSVPGSTPSPPRSSVCRSRASPCR